ncbi:metallophosphoesterase [Actinopolymorpha sp. B11F2]|uniref:metallophosphoesterase family protein n=1 Tax=Actinopolymorpha sp. B11F2 TaxID=3160862 RepID=UPI0032E37CD5
MTVRIAQISDLHFGREIPRIAEVLLDDLRAARPTVVAVCGDLTQRAREREFAAAKAFLDELPAPALVVCGNHDLPGWRVWSRFARPWRRWRRHITATDPNAAVSLTADGLAAVGVNTARRWGPHPDWSRGRISARQVAAIEEAFDAAAPGDLRVVVAHHPFLLTTAGRSRGMVGGSALALRRLRHRADLLLGGHVHLGYSGVVAGMVVAQAGTAFSNRLKGEPNGYNLIDADETGLTVTMLRCVEAGFEAYDRSRYVRDNEGWRAA